jgi:hypothetical protein
MPAAEYHGAVQTNQILQPCVGIRAAIALAIVPAFLCLADDAAGLIRLEVAPTGEVSGEMPVVPFGDATPSSFLSGPFWDGAGGTTPDWLFLFSESRNLDQEAAYSPDGWIDPDTGEPTDMTVEVGDTLVFVPGEGDDGSPFDVFLFGRVPGVASRSGSPRIRGMSVDPLGAFADIDIFTRGLAIDLYSFDFETNGVVFPWAHLGRHPGFPIFLGLRDDTLPATGGRVYLAADATRDSDGDGIPDEMECRIHGTSPLLSDSDGDGLSDALELAWGGNPLKEK